MLRTSKLLGAPPTIHAASPFFLCDPSGSAAQLHGDNVGRGSAAGNHSGLAGHGCAGLLGFAQRKRWLPGAMPKQIDWVAVNDLK